DEESGLIYFGLRYYDPSIHQWISPDPLGTFDGPNVYAFLHNNPLTSLDRLGLAKEDLPQDAFKNYFYGNLENHCYCERHRDCKRGGDIGNNRLGGSAMGISNYYIQTAEFFLQTPLAFLLVPPLTAG